MGLLELLDYMEFLKGKRSQMRKTYMGAHEIQWLSYLRDIGTEIERVQAELDSLN